MSERKTINVSTEEALRQNQIIDILSLTIKDKGLRYCISTFGCQMNARDSEKIEGILTKIGYEKTEREEDADFILYNTCCVRENAELKVFGKLGQLKSIKQKKPGLIIALCGCMMQQDVVLEKLKKQFNFVDIIFGTYNIYKLPELMQTYFETKQPVIDIWDSYQDIVEDLPNVRKYPHKACVNIIYGCDNFCTYCIVPYVRGRERSRAKEDIIREVKDLVANGIKEIMLLGQNVNSYGKTLPDKPTFAELLREIDQIDGLKRVRFMTSHPKDLSDDLIKALAECKTVCKVIHLPLQSGSTRILKKMNRRYTKEGYLTLVQKLRSAVPEIEITTDIIVGFPGETEEDFLDTLDVVEKAKFNGAFTFIYSKRTGTPAATMEDQIEEEIVKDRFNRLTQLVDQVQLERMQRYVGKTEEIMFEEVSKNDPSIISGRTDSGILVHVKGEKDLIGTLKSVFIKEAKTHYLLGEIL